MQSQALQSIKELTRDIDIIDNAVEVAPALLGVTAQQLDMVQNDLMIQRSIEEFQYFYNYKL